MRDTLPQLLIELDLAFFEQLTVNKHDFCNMYELTDQRFDTVITIYTTELSSQLGLTISRNGDEYTAPADFKGLYTEQPTDGDIVTVVQVNNSERVRSVLSVLNSAIKQRRSVSLIYTSISSGSGAREVVPHTIVNNGSRLHVRGFDRKTQTFRDFVINRISQVKLVDVDLAQYEVRSNDHLWNRVVTLKLVPHPHNAHTPTAVEMEFEMIDGCLTVDLRAALVGYYLRQHNVDASENAELRGEPYQLWLQNRGSVFDTDNLFLAPGF